MVEQTTQVVDPKESVGDLPESVVDAKVPSPDSVSARALRTVRSGFLRIAVLTTVFGCTVSAVAGSGSDDASEKISFSPAAHFRKFLQTGQASWYGPRFQGRKTANGEKFNMNALTCAHRSLPIGTWLRVTNLTNRKSVMVRVNDRGPYVGRRIIDLSYAAARSVGIGGVSKVKVEQVPLSDPEITLSLVSQLTPFNFPEFVPAR